MNTYQNALIEPSELNTLLNSKEKACVKILDATFVLPGSDQNPAENYQAKRIDRAVFFDIKAIADQSSHLPHMLPCAEEFERAVGMLGISNDDTVIIYGQHNMLMGPARVWWMFRIFGHDNVKILNGALPAWEREGYALNTNAPKAPIPASFKAIFKPELVRNRDEVLKACTDKNALILDARPAARFSGASPEPRPGMCAGSIPCSVNIPCPSLVDPDTGKLKPKEELLSILETAGYHAGTPVITTCGSGVTACVITLALFQLGEHNVSVYDGSWSEWGQESLCMPIDKV